MDKSVKITPPEGYEVDKEKSTFEKIMFKKKGLGKLTLSLIIVCVCLLAITCHLDHRIKALEKEVIELDIKILEYEHITKQ